MDEAFEMLTVHPEQYAGGLPLCCFTDLLEPNEPKAAGQKKAFSAAQGLPSTW